MHHINRWRYNRVRLYFMEQGPWEASNSLASQENSYNLRDHFHVDNRLPIAPSLGQINPVRVLPFYSQYMFILCSHLRLGLASGFFPWVSAENPQNISFLPNECYMPILSYWPWFHQSNNVWCVVQIMKLLIMQFSPVSCHFLSFVPKYFLSAPSFGHTALVIIRNQFSNRYERRCKVIAVYIWMFIYRAYIKEWCGFNSEQY